jgi:uncharacterized repeat protein (TIGR03803 family)
MTQDFRLTSRLRSILAAAFLLASSALLPAQTPTVTTLVNFTGGTNGGYPFSTTLVQGTNGEFYGVTGQGGATSTNSGTVFDVTPQGSLTTLDSFCCHYIFADGNEPGQLTQTAGGVLYGMTGIGGLGGLSTCTSQGFSLACGTIFQLGPDGQLTYLYNFSGPDGEYPYAPLVQGTDGNLYGIAGGGSNGGGVFFKFVPGFSLNVLYNFCNLPVCPDDTASGPGSLLLGADGNFYGVAGAVDAAGGAIFEITPQGALTTLAEFPCTQASCPATGLSSLMQAANGNFYGTAVEGGTGIGNSSCNQIGGVGGDGAIFEMTPGQAPVILHSFDGTDGAIPDASLIQATDGNLYGTTACGGTNNAGTIYQITPAGAFTSLYSFAGSPGLGGGTQGGLVQATNGMFYGTTPKGGTDNDGTVFSLSMGLSPFIKTFPTSGGIGAPVLILGNNLTGANDVSFDGMVAAFTVVSDSEIQTTVPTGATTGTVKVTTPGATLSSNLPFTVTSQLVAATPTISPAAGTYASEQSVTISDATAGAAIFYTTDGSTPTTASSRSASSVLIPSSGTLQAIAIASGYSPSAVAAADYTIQNPSNPVPALSSISPAYVIVGDPAFTLTVTGSAFTSQSVIYWGSSALATQYVSATQLTAQVTAAQIANTGITAITVQNPAPGGGTSSSLQFDVGANQGTMSIFSIQTVFLNPGTSATYPVSLPPSATNVSVQCLNLPPGASCFYSGTAKAVTILTSSTTPFGTYQIVVVFSETVSDAARTLALVPIFLLPLAFARKRWASRGIGLLVCLVFALLLTAMISGCGKTGGGSGGGGGGGGGGGSQSTSTGAVTLVVQ